MGWESSYVVIFAFGPSFKVKRGQSNFKVLITHLILVLEICNVKPTYRKSWAGNLLMWSHLTLGPAFKVKQGQPNLKSSYNSLIVGPRGLQCVNLWEIMG